MQPQSSGPKSAQLLKFTAWWTLAVWLAIAAQQTFWFLSDSLPSRSISGFALRKLILFMALAGLGITYAVLVLRRNRYSAMVGSGLLCIFSAWALSEPVVQIVSHWDSIDLSRTSVTTRLALAEWLSFCCLAPLWFFCSICFRPAAPAEG